MAGTTIELFSRRTFDFSGLSNSQNTELVLNTMIDVDEWTQGVIVARVNALTLVTGATVDLIARPTIAAPEDPNLDFVTSTNQTTLNITGTAPLMLLGALTANFGGGLRIIVRGARATTAGTISCTMSAALVMKA